MVTINELFNLNYGHSLELNHLERSDNTDAINFVSRAARNNGVTARVAAIPNIFPAKKGTITVALGGNAGVAFLQPKPYYCGRDVMILTAKSADMTIKEKLWWVTCITANRFRFGFGRQANKSLKNILLPNPKDIPFWVNTVDTENYRGIDAPAKLCEPLQLNVNSWQCFRVNQLFEIHRGTSLNKLDFIQGSIPYVSATSYDNGVSARIHQPAKYPGGTISISHNGSIGEAFYQPQPFWASGDVSVLYPKDFSLTPSVALFICTIFRK